MGLTIQFLEFNCFLLTLAFLSTSFDSFSHVVITALQPSTNVSTHPLGITASMITLTQDCQGFVATEGEYTLQQDIFLDQVPAHPVIPTYVSSVSVKYKDYQNSTGNGTHNGGAGSDIHGMIAALTLERLDDHLKDLKVTEGKEAADDESGGHLAGNFHGTLVDLPLFNDDSPKGAGAGGSGGGMMSPGPPQVMTPGPPPLKDSTPIKEINHAQGTKSLGRAATFPMLHDISESSQGISSYATIGPSLAASVGLTSLFSGKRKKNNIAKTNSTFVTKITTNENLSKILANRVNEDVYVFWNTGKTFTWSELGQKPNVNGSNKAICWPNNTFLSWFLFSVVAIARTGRIERINEEKKKKRIQGLQPQGFFFFFSSCLLSFRQY